MLKSKKCVKGKSCGSTCIQSDRKCLKDLDPQLSPATSKVAELIKSKTGVKEAAAPAGATPPAEKVKEKIKKKEESFESAQKKRDKAQLAANLSPDEKKAINDYTEESGGRSPRSYDKMNGCLRRPEGCPNKEESEKFVKEFDDVLTKLPKNADGNAFYRGVGVYSDQTEQLYKFLETATPGTRLKDPGYGSYSAEKRRAESFVFDHDVENIMFISRNKDLTPVNMYSAIKNENEAVLPRGIEQTIRKVTKEGATLIVEID